MHFVDVIARKRDGHSLTRQEIDHFVAGASSGAIPDYQTSALLMAVVLSIRARRTPHAAVAGLSAEGTPGISVNAAARHTPELRRLMLVNLPPNAAAAELENATPLGTQHSVRSALAQVLPGITFNDHGLGQFNHADHTMLFDLVISGMMQAALIPVLSEYTAPEKREELRRITGALLVLAGIVVGSVVAFLMIFAPAAVRVMTALGGGEDSRAR